jgi:predicted permease
VKIGLYTAPDPMFLFVMMLANSTPGAVNLQTMTILFNNRAEEMAQILFWSYVSALLVLPVNVALFIQIITWFFPQ